VSQSVPAVFSGLLTTINMLLLLLLLLSPCLRFSGCGLRDPTTGQIEAAAAARGHTPLSLGRHGPSCCVCLSLSVWVCVSFFGVWPAWPSISLESRLPACLCSRVLLLLLPTLSPPRHHPPPPPPPCPAAWACVLASRPAVRLRIAFGCVCGVRRWECTRECLRALPSYTCMLVWAETCGGRRRVSATCRHGGVRRPAPPRDAHPRCA
jgi:hypothetical protein